MELLDKQKAQTEIAWIAKYLARSDAQKAIIGRILFMIDNLPTIEAEPVRIGRWVVEDDCEHFIARCSECGRSEDSRMVAEMPYCHCGARMDRRQNC